VQWSDAMCTTSSETRPTSPSRATETLADRLAADPLFCDLLANVHLHLEHQVDLERVFEIRDLGFSEF